MEFLMKYRWIIFFKPIKFFWAFFFLTKIKCLIPDANAYFAPIWPAQIDYKFEDGLMKNLNPSRNYLSQNWNPLVFCILILANRIISS